MSKHKSTGKEKKKGSQLVIRVDKAERDAFVTLCDRLDTSASREIRRFMRELVATHAGATAISEEAAESAAVADGKGDEPASADITPGETGAEAGTPVVDAEKQRKKQKRALH